MKNILLICVALLLLALAPLPIGYYTLLRIVVTIGAVLVVLKEYEKGFNFWVISFGLIALLFNPLIPIYLGGKGTWVPIDLIAAVLFFIKAIGLKINRL